MRRNVEVALVTLGLALLGGAFLTLVAAPGPGDGSSPGAGPDLIEVPGSEQRFWPWLSTSRAFEARSPINLVVVGTDVTGVHAILAAQGWNATSENQSDAADSTYELLPPDEASEAPNGSADARPGTGDDAPGRWGNTTGADRYAYTEGAGEGRWDAQRLQVHQGTYFGGRTHIRLYDAPEPGDWVLLQAHSEYFDWFTLRHTVTGVAGAQAHVEASLMEHPAVVDVSRRHLDNAGVADNDGWATFVVVAHLAPVAVLATRGEGPTARRGRHEEARQALRELWAALGRRASLDHGYLALAVAGLILGVRGTGILLEAQVPSLTPHLVAALLYPALLVGLPLAVVLQAHRLEHRVDAGGITTVAFLVAGALDLALVGVDTLPLSLIAQRTTLVLGLGLVGAGSARRATRDRWWNGLMVAGMALWCGGAAATLLGWW